MFQLICLCAIILLGQETGAVMDPHYEYVKEANTWLRLHTMPAKWQDALMRCKLEGGVLASPSTTVLTKAMLSMMTSLNVLSLGAFTGIHDLISEDDFMSLDGMPVSDIHLKWVYNEPNNKNDEENCVILTSTGELAQERCASKHPYFCRKENATMGLHKDCQTYAAGYEYENRTGSCYKFHREAVPWHRAAKACHTEGGYLAIVNSELESEVLKEIFVKHPAHLIVGAYYQYVASIGVWKWNDPNGEWLTINGETLEEAGYAKFAPGQPNNVGGKQTCCAFERNGGLNDVEPTMLIPFICEINLSIHT